MDGAPPHTMTPKVVQELKLRYEGLKSGVERANAQEHWEQIAEVIDPNHRGFVGKRTPGDRRMQKVYDATGIHAADLLTAGLHGTATNPATKWHRLSTQFPDANKDPGVRGYLDKRVEILFSRRYSPGTRFTSAINEVFDSASRYGTGIMYITQRRDGRNLYECRSLSECVIAENDEGDIDTVMRCFTWTVRQCVLEWGVDGVSDKVREMYNARKFDEIIEVIHSVTPRPRQQGLKKYAVRLDLFRAEHGARPRGKRLPQVPVCDLPVDEAPWRDLRHGACKCRAAGRQDASGHVAGDD
jgi:hypothetical protein